MGSAFSLCFQQDRAGKDCLIAKLTGNKIAGVDFLFVDLQRVSAEGLGEEVDLQLVDGVKQFSAIRR